MARMREEPDQEVLGNLFYPGEIIVKSSFVSGSVRLSLSFQDLEDWGRCLNSLEDEESIAWPSGGRSARVEIFPEDPLLAKVVDSPSSQVSVCVPLDVSLEVLLEENKALLSDAFDRIRAEM